LCCAAAIANLDLMASRGTVAHAAAVGEELGRLLQPLTEHAGVVEVRRCGTMTGIELAPVPGLDRTGFEVCRAARRRGVLIRPLGDVVVLMPPLAIDADQVRQLTDAVTESIYEVCQ
jgi:adenosylmethionine-8-amino-7-oxononanoate aminotransferase